jgi:hypothetical protein
MRADFSIPIPEGSYLAHCIESVSKTAKSGKVYINLTFDMDTEVGARRVWDKLFFTEKAYPRLEKACKAMGVDLPDGRIFDQEFVGKTVILDLIIEKTPAGGLTNKVAYHGYHKKPDELTLNTAPLRADGLVVEDGLVPF